MRKLLVAVLMALMAAPPTFAASRIDISPNTIGSNDRAPQVCISGFKANSFVSVDLPQISYGFIVGERGTYCYQSDYIMQGLAAGDYEVPSTACHYVVGSLPSRCKDGPTATLTVN